MFNGRCLWRVCFGSLLPFDYREATAGLTLLSLVPVGRGVKEAAEPAADTRGQRAKKKV